MQAVDSRSTARYFNERGTKHREDETFLRAHVQHRSDLIMNTCGSSKANLSRTHCKRHLSNTAIRVVAFGDRFEIGSNPQIGSAEQQGLMTDANQKS
jgi:hypothetical protein